MDCGGGQELFKVTLLLATPQGFDPGRKVLQESWQNISAVSIGTKAYIRTYGGAETRRSYAPVLIVQRRSGEQTTFAYPEHFGRPWQDLFRYINAVAPHVQLADLLEAQRFDHEQRRR